MNLLSFIYQQNWLYVVIAGILLIQLIVAMLNYSKDWKEPPTQKDNTQHNILNNTKKNHEINNVKKSNSSVESILKKALLTIPVLPLSALYLLLKLNYHIVKIILYNFIDLIINSLHYYLYSFPDRFEEDIILLVDNYICHPVKFIYQKIIVPTYTIVSEWIIIIKTNVFSKENFEKLLELSKKLANFIYSNILLPFYTKAKSAMITAKGSIVKAYKIVCYHGYNLGSLFAKTIILFTKDLFEDVQLAWSGIQWFGVNIGKPAASFLEEIFLCIFIRPIAHTCVFFYILMKKLVKLIVYNTIKLICLIPTLSLYLINFFLNILGIKALLSLINSLTYKFIFLPLCHALNIIIGQVKTLVLIYLPRQFKRFIAFLSKIYTKYAKYLTFHKVLISFFRQASLKAYDMASEWIKNLERYFPIIHQYAAFYSKKCYDWIKYNLFPIFTNLVSTLTMITWKNLILPAFSVLKQCLSLAYNHMIILGQWLEKYILKYLTVVGIHILTISNLIWTSTKTSVIQLTYFILPYSETLFKVLINWTNQTIIQLKPIVLHQLELTNVLIQRIFSTLWLFIIDYINKVNAQLNDYLIKSNKYLSQSFQSKRKFNDEYLSKLDTTTTNTHTQNKKDD